MSMTKHAYDQIAQGLNLGKPSKTVNPSHIERQGQDVLNVYTYGKDNAWYNAVMTLAEYLEANNDNFDRAVFLSKAGVQL